jgi:ribosome-associated translation inhibitor RaiA
VHPRGALAKRSRQAGLDRRQRRTNFDGSAALMPEREREAMLIQINTHDTAGDDDFTGRVEAAVATGLDRFAGHLTRVEVHLGDVNAGKHGAADKRCMIEARPNNHQPIAVTHQAESIPLAIDGAIEKARRALDKALASRTDHKGRSSVRDNELK